MSMDEAGSGNPLETTEKKKSTRKVKVRKHLLTTAYKQDVAEKLDKLDAAGHSLVAIIPSSDIRGFEIITVIEE
jgi:hypothetical protein